MNREKRDLLIALNATMKSGWLPLGNEGMLKAIKKYNVKFNKLSGKWN